MMRANILVLIFCFLLSACGKSGSPKGSDPTPGGTSAPSNNSSAQNSTSSSGQSSSLKSQTFIFSDTEPLGLLITENSRRLTIRGTKSSGTSTFKSSNSTVATVDANGLLTLLKEGTTTISLTVAADNEYAERTATLTVNIAPSQELVITALVGENDTKISLLSNSNIPGLKISRTTQFDCDFTNITNCINGQVSDLGVAPVTDTALNLTTPAYYKIDFGLHTSYNGIDSAFVSSNIFSGKLADHKVVFFKENYWMVGAPSKTLSDKTVGRGGVWRSHNGGNWQKVVDVPPFGDLYNHELVVFKNKVWLVGGRTVGTNKPNIWSSADGINWILEKENIFPLIDSSFSFKAIPFNNKLWIFTGDNKFISDSVTKAYSSSDAINWSFEGGFNLNPNASWQLPIFTEFKGFLWTISGVSPASGYRYKISKSLDGVNWSTQSFLGAYSNKISSGRSACDTEYDGNLFVFDGKIHFYCEGISLQPEVKSYSDSLSSDDGITWAQGNSPLPDNSKLSGAQIVARDNILVAIGGDITNSGSALYSSKGKDLTWQPFVTNKVDLLPINNSAIAFFKGKLWSIGGVDLQGHITNKIFSSVDGISWEENKLANNLTPRRNHALLAFGGKLWLVGGVEPYKADASKFGPSLNDVWVSTDGTDWKLVTANANFSQRENMQLIEYQNIIWLFGGLDSKGKQLDDIWATADGISWYKKFSVSDMQSTIPNNSLAAGILSMQVSLTFPFNLIWAGSFYDQDPTTHLMTASKDTCGWGFDNNTYTRYSCNPQSYNFGVMAGTVVKVNDKYVALNYSNEVFESFDGATWKKIGEVPYRKWPAFGIPYFADYERMFYINGNYFIYRSNEYYDSTNRAIEILTSTDAKEWRQINRYRFWMQ